MVDAFATQVASTEPLWFGRGQCIEHHGAGEAYLPLLKALGQIGRSPNGAEIIPLLYQYAPSWLLHLPALVPAIAIAALKRHTGGEMRERMSRELAEAVEILAAERSVLLGLEDLPGSDVSTLDWLAYIARRRGRLGYWGWRHTSR